MRYKRILYLARHFLIFFLLIAFILTCNIILFTKTLQSTTGIELTRQTLHPAAVMTFLNVIMLSAVCTGIDTIRRHYTITQPVKKIVTAAKKIMAGDLSVRIENTEKVPTGLKPREILTR